MIPLNYTIKRVTHVEVGDVMCLLDRLYLVIGISTTSILDNIRFETFDLEYGHRRAHVANVTEHRRVFT